MTFEPAYYHVTAAADEAVIAFHAASNLHAAVFPVCNNHHFVVAVALGLEEHCFTVGSRLPWQR